MQTQEYSAQPPAPPLSFSMTQSAAARINQLKAKQGNDALRFRVTVKGGGCSGFQYEFGLDGEAVPEGDLVFSLNGAQVVVDEVSLGLVSGSQLDYVEDLSQAGFEIKNPQATAKCGCGNSFSIAL